MTTYDVGDLVRLAVEFTDADGAPADPTAVSLRVKHGSTTDVYTDAETDSTGAYHKDVEATAPGAWSYRWIGTGAVQAAEEGRFFVRTPSA